MNLPVCNGINGIDSALLRFYYNFNQRVKVIFKTLGIGNTLLVPNLVKPSQTCGFSFPFCGVFLHISQPHRKGIFAYFATPQKGTQKECFSTIPPRSRAVKEPGHGSQPGPNFLYSLNQPDVFIFPGTSPSLHLCNLCPVNLHLFCITSHLQYNTFGPKELYVCDPKTPTLKAVLLCTVILYQSKSVK